MATLYISEHSDIAESLRGAVQILLEDGTTVVEQTIPISVVSTPCTNPFAATTRFVRIHSDAICSIAFGTSPTASTANKRLAANQTEVFGVKPGSNFKVAVITNT